jgi:Flp pilus assembly protein TadG
MICIVAKRKQQRGAVAVEAAVALVFLILPMLLGSWEMGRMVEVQQLLSNAAREGSRQASTGQLTSAQAQQVVLNYMLTTGIPTQNAKVTVSDLTVPGTDVQQAAYLDKLQVRVTIPFSDVRVISLMLVTTSTSKMTGQAIWYSLKDRAYQTPQQPPIE